MNYNEYVDPSLRQAVINTTDATLSQNYSPDDAIKKGLLEIKEPPKFASGSALNEAVMKRARDKFYDPTLGAEMQKLRYVQGQAQKLDNASNRIMSIYQLDRQAEQMAKQRKAAEDSQRAAVLSSVLGLGGAVAGAMIAGPAGAAVGSQAGGAVGGMASKSQSNVMMPG